MEEVRRFSFIYLLPFLMIINIKIFEIVIQITQNFNRFSGGGGFAGRGGSGGRGGGGFSKF